MPIPIRILVFAHVPPPHHGQSAMVKLMLDGLGAPEFRDRLELFHVDARFSDRMTDIGSGSATKLWRAVKFAAQAIRLRFRHGIEVLYYIPAPPKPSAMVRDWIVMALCRPFFPGLILHWHAVGLGEWTQEHKTGGRLITKLAARLNVLFLGHSRLSLPLTEWGRGDVAPFRPHRVAVVGNGIADPCPDFDQALLPVRRQRQQELRDVGPKTYRVCFLGHCTAEKGLWDVMEAVGIANTLEPGRGSQTRLVLRVAGEFPAESDRQRFADLSREIAARYDLPMDWVSHAGFVGGEAKRDFLRQADCLCVPTRYAAESFGLVAVEALAFGIPAVASDWRMLPDLMAAAGLPVARVGDHQHLAEALLASIGRDDPARLRAAFTQRFTAAAHLATLAAALGEAGVPVVAASGDSATLT
jgi:glycosyltransferase involved in cell wall biosynthesis